MHCNGSQSMYAQIRSEARGPLLIMVGERRWPMNKRRRSPRTAYPLIRLAEDGDRMEDQAVRRARRVLKGQVRVVSIRHMGGDWVQYRIEEVGSN